MASAGVLSLGLSANVKVNVNGKLANFGLQESPSAIVARTQHDLKSEEIGTALPRPIVPHGNASPSQLRLAPQTAVVASEERVASTGPPTQVCRSQPHSVPRPQSAEVAPPATRESPQQVADASAVDPMDALMELSRAADMLSSLGSEPAAAPAASGGASPSGPAHTGAGEEPAGAERVTSAPVNPGPTQEPAAAERVAAAPAKSGPTHATKDAAAFERVTAAPAIPAPTDAVKESAARQSAQLAREDVRVGRNAPQASNLAVASGTAASQGQSPVQERPPRAASQPRPSATTLEERVRRLKDGSVKTAIGEVKLGDYLDVKWVEGDGLFYTASVTALTDAGVTVVYPQSGEWDEWDEVLRIDELVQGRVKRAAAPPRVKAVPKATTRLKRKHPDGHSDGAGCSWTEREDAQLRQLVQDEGVGNWETKAAKFISTRTPNALRQRWCSHLSHLPALDDETASTTTVVGDHGNFGWSSREDQKLRQMVARYGTGNWESKAVKFDTDRSAAALRFRWYKLAKESGHAVVKGEREVIDASRWTAREDHQLANLVKTEGPGNWRQKAESFDTDRSADALRFRWYVIQKEGDESVSNSDEISEAPVENATAQTTGRRSRSSANGSQPSEDERSTRNAEQVHPPSAWLASEDVQLRALVRKEGPGNWQHKANSFKTGRSAGALRFRWYVLKEEDEEEASSENSVIVETPATGSVTKGKKRLRESANQQHAEKPSAKLSRAINDRQLSTATLSEWTIAEDMQLHELVAHSGAGNWKAKSKNFKNEPRSAGSLRTRWAYLKDKGVVVDPSTGEHLQVTVPEASINEEDQEWRSALETGFTCLCLYSKSWYEVTVVEMKSDEDGVRSTRRNGESVKVHYVGWKSYYDEWIPKLSQRLWSQGSTPRWFKKYELIEGSGGDGTVPLRLSANSWTKAEDALLSELCDSPSINWARIARRFDANRTEESLRTRWSQLQADSECAVESDADDDDTDAEDDKSYNTRGGTVPDPNGRKPKSKALPKALAWTEEEDELLKKLIERSGPTDWQSKAEQFDDRRSAGALRRRWCFLRDEMVDEDATADEKSPPWTTPEDTKLRKLVTNSGANHWDEKAAHFTSSGRSADSLRYRWTYVLKHQAIDAAVVDDNADDSDSGEDDEGAGDDDLSEDDTSRFDPPTGSIRERAAAKEDKAWRSGLDVGSTCACFSHNEIFAAKVTETRAAKKSGMGIGMLKVHYLGWSSKYDEWISRTSSRLHRAEAAGQSHSLQSSSRARAETTTGGASAPTAGSGGSWSALEDKQLRVMCIKDGSGNWDDKAARFTAGERTASALRQRWAKLQSEATQKDASRGASTDVGGRGANRWSEEEDTYLCKMVAKTNQNWSLISSRFVTDRSASALRRRWYTLQVLDEEEERGTSSDEGDGAQDSASSSSWLPAEDVELRKLVAQSGPGDWETKAAKFSTNRSSGALRFRWYHLRDADTADQPAAPSSPGGATGWTDAEDAQLRRLVKQFGEGDWHEKAAAFKTSRSSSSVRHRWYSFLAIGAEANSLAASEPQPTRSHYPRSRRFGGKESSAANVRPSRALRSRSPIIASGSESTDVTDEELARQLQRELNGVRKREAVRYTPFG